jgi:tetratricopeptide (TPR) repeat protein
MKFFRVILRRIKEKSVKKMSKKKVNKQAQDSTFENVEQALSRTEHFIEKNQKRITTIAVIVALIVLGYWGYKKYILAPKVIEAQEYIFPAQQYFEKDSFNLALNGDGNNFGFLDIIDNYGSTPSGNLAEYYAGICYLNLGNFEEAANYLNNYNGDDLLTNVAAKGALGDAYVEMGDKLKGAEYYEKAASVFTNDFTTPLYLMKAAEVYFSEKKYDKALSIYTRIESEFPESREYRNIEKYISHTKTMMNS